jgi:hypothetical protein
MRGVPAGQPTILLFGESHGLPLDMKIPSDSPEAFALKTGLIRDHAVVVAAGNGPLGLKQAVHRLVIKSRQDAASLTIPTLDVAETPWIPNREWALCPWTPQLVRGWFANPAADQRMNVWLYGDQQLRCYVDMFDWFGFSGGQLLETCTGYAALGSLEALQSRQRVLADALRRNGQQVTLWVWAAMFKGFGWSDPSDPPGPVPGNDNYGDPAIHAMFEKYYDHYAGLAPLIDRLIAHFYDPGILDRREDVFKYMRLLQAKVKAANPKVEMAIDAWATGPDYVDQLIANGFQDYLLLAMSMPNVLPMETRNKMHETAKARGMRFGVWGWYMTEYESDQMPAMYVNARLLKKYYQDIRENAHRIHPVHYWSEMEANHLNNLYSMYAAGQLLWNPDRDPDELVAEVADAIWGSRNGVVVQRALMFVQEMRTGDSWDTYWHTLPGYRLGSADPASDARRAAELLDALRTMKNDDAYVPKIPLPFPPQTFIELMLPHLEQIRLYAEFRVKVERIRQAATAGADKPALTAKLKDAWQPVPDFNTWIGTHGQIEQRLQEATVRTLARELRIVVEDPAWLRWRDGERILGLLRGNQLLQEEPAILSTTAGNEFYFSQERFVDRVNLLAREGLLEKAGDDTYRLANWQAWRRVK